MVVAIDQAHTKREGGFNHYSLLACQKGWRCTPTLCLEIDTPFLSFFKKEKKYPSTPPPPPLPPIVKHLPWKIPVYATAISVKFYPMFRTQDFKGRLKLCTPVNITNPRSYENDPHHVGIGPLGLVQLLGVARGSPVMTWSGFWTTRRPCPRSLTPWTAGRPSRIPSASSSALPGTGPSFPVPLSSSAPPEVSSAFP